MTLDEKIFSTNLKFLDELEDLKKGGCPRCKGPFNLCNAHFREKTGVEYTALFLKVNLYSERSR